MKAIAVSLLASAPLLPLAAQAGSVTFNAPLAGSAVSGTLGGSACAVTTPGGTSRVEFFLDSTALNVDSSSPWNCALDTTQFADGNHMLKAIAYDKRERTSTGQVSINIQNTTTPPPPPPPTGSTPYSGTPVVIPATIEAENFDKGGEGVAYHDNVPGNAGGQYRTAEDVDIIVSSDSAGGGYVINNFETGEWMKYTINVPTTGNYDLALRAASTFSTSAFHIEVDSTNVTGQVAVPNTGSWTVFQWVTGKTGVPMAAGNHVLKVVADQQYFNLNQIRVAATAATPPPPPPSAAFFCTFANSPTDCGFSEQAKVSGRATIVNIGRDGSTAVRLHTESGDSNVNGSGTWERNDLSLGPSSSYCNQGQDEWWAHSVLFPSDYVFPPSGGAGIVMDFHHNASSGQSNFEVQLIPGVGIRLEGHGGPTIDGGRYDYVVPDPYGVTNNVMRNVWYDFVYHVKWSSGSDGLMEGWLNGKKVMSYSGPTLYTGISCYLKLANYHSPTGQANSVIHDRVVRGSTAASVALTPLEGVP